MFNRNGRSLSPRCSTDVRLEKVQRATIVDRLSTDVRLKSVTIFLADYDTETALKKTLRITQQSTFVVFKHGHEVARSTGQTQEQVIRAIFEKAL